VRLAVVAFGASAVSSPSTAAYAGKTTPAAFVVAVRNDFGCASFEGCAVYRANRGRMPSSAYYRVQAKVLLRLMLAMGDSQRAKKVEAKAREYLVQAELPEQDRHEMNTLLEEFNNSQLRKRRARDD
jgi:hypothetical protein